MKIFGIEFGRRKSLNESALTNNSNNNDYSLRQDLDSINEFSFPYLDTSELDDLWNQSGDKKLRYESYDQMATDTIISSALEMYADDASQYDANNNLIWAESEDTELSEILNRRLKELGLKGKLWSMYYSLAKYGEVYLRQYKYRTVKGNIRNDEDVKEDVKYEPFISIVDRPENVFDFSKYGKTVKFAYLDEDEQDAQQNYIASGTKKRSIELYPADQFIHIYLDKPDVRSRKRETVYLKGKDNSDQPTEITYDVVEGQSMLEGIYSVQRQIQLLETSIILNRLSKSAITRVVSVEVGDMSSKDVPGVLRRIKSSLENRISLNTGKDMTDYTSSPGGLDNVVVVPTREGKGAITTSNIGGDVDVKSLSDLDYFNNKRFGGLKIPKAFMGYEQDLGNNGGGTLTKQDIRYGRTIKRLQTAMVTGITTLMVWYLKGLGRSQEDLTNFTIKVVPPTTADDDERDQKNDANFKLANNILDMVGDDADKSKVLSYIFTNIINEPGLAEVIKNSMNKPDEPAEDEASDDDADNSDDTDKTVDSSSTPSDDINPLTPDNQAKVSNDSGEEVPEGTGDELNPERSEEPTEQSTASNSSAGTTVTVPSQKSAIK